MSVISSVTRLDTWPHLSSHSSICKTPFPCIMMKSHSGGDPLYIFYVDDSRKTEVNHMDQNSLRIKVKLKKKRDSPFFPKVAMVEYDI